MWTRFTWLFGMVFTDLGWVYLLLATLPGMAGIRGVKGALRALGVVALVHVGPLLSLLCATLLYGRAREFAVLHLVPIALAVAGVWVVVRGLRVLRQDIPRWTVVAFLAGVVIINLMTLFIAGMALADDWV